MPIACIAAIGLVDLIWSQRAGVVFVGMQPALLAITLCLCVSVIYSTLRPVPALRELSLYAGLWIGFTASGCILTYLAASVPRPLIDVRLAHWDAMLGFDWVAWSQAVQSHPAGEMVLRVAYHSLAPQIIASLIYFALSAVPRRNRELLLCAMFALCLTALISAWWPALGPWVHFAQDPAKTTNAPYVRDLMALRQGTGATFRLVDLQGIVTVPSYHTVLALLLTWTHRGRATFAPLLALNVIMLLALPSAGGPSTGGHYLVDMLAGSAVALAAIGVVCLLRWLPAWPGLPILPPAIARPKRAG